MSRRRWAIWIRPPTALVAVSPVILAGVLVACSGARLTASLWSSHAERSTAPADIDRTANRPPQAGELDGKTWLAEGPTGWEAGRIGGRSIRLGRAEVGLATGGSWIVTAILKPTHSVTLLVRAGPAADPKRVDLGSLAPTATVIAGDHAYVSGFSFAQPTDPGILDIDLATATARVLLPASDAIGIRYLAVSADGSTLVSSLCDQVADPEPATCSMTVVSLPDGTATFLGDVRGGLPRAASSEVAVVAPPSHEAPERLAGIDLKTGAELWSVAGGELGRSVMNVTHGLIQERILLDGPKPRLVIEAINLRTGTAKVVYQEARAGIGALWPELCSDRFIAVGDDATGSRALGAAADGRARVRLVPLDGGDPLDLPVTLRSNP